NCGHAFDTMEYLTDSEIDLDHVKLHNRVYDHFEDDPTISLQAMWNGINLSVTGLVNSRFSVFEIDFYFEFHKVSIKNAGDNFEFYRLRNEKECSGPLSLQPELSQDHCIKDYMSHVIDHARQLLDDDEIDDNFSRSVGLNLKMVKYLNN
ncbi:MAG TPA: hypothetical protein VKR32_07110, partial [Puia sp.]|nr:hypothetical protein [Puia sp.]